MAYDGVNSVITVLRVLMQLICVIICVDEKVYLYDRIHANTHSFLLLSRLRQFFSLLSSIECIYIWFYFVYLCVFYVVNYIRYIVGLQKCSPVLHVVLSYLWESVGSLFYLTIFGCHWLSYSVKIFHSDDCLHTHSKVAARSDKWWMSDKMRTLYVEALSHH